MTLTRAVALPPASTVGGGVLGSARPLPDGWERGVQFAADACLVAGTHLFCPTSPGEKAFQGTDIAEFDPFGVEVSVACTTLTSAEAKIAGANAVLETVAEFNVGAALATGVGTDNGDGPNPALADATALAAAATAAEALATIEDSIATSLRGHLAWVHVAPSTLLDLVAADVVYLDGMGNWRTPTGHLVVASPGYVTALADEIVATTEVFADVGDVEQVRMVDWTDNRHLAVHEAPALAVFDPCFNVSVTITDSP